MQFYAFMVAAVAFWMQTSRPGGPGLAPYTEKFLLLELLPWDTELATAATGLPGQQLLCRESRMLLGSTLSADSLISSQKLCVQDESSGEQITWARSNALFCVYQDKPTWHLSSLKPKVCLSW